MISTHALREEGDVAEGDEIPFTKIFLPTPSARRATVQLADEIAAWEQFLPTPSARRATISGVDHIVVKIISTHALREEGDGTVGGKFFASKKISTHALREEGDRYNWAFTT